MLSIQFLGVRIHALVKRILIYKFHNEVVVDGMYCIQSFNVAWNNGYYGTTQHPYKINF